MLILLGAVALMVLVVVANVSRSRSTVRGIEVNIRYGRQPQLVNSQVVKDSILAVVPALLQQQVGQVDRQTVAEAASHVPFLSDVSASTSESYGLSIQESFILGVPAVAVNNPGVSEVFDERFGLLTTPDEDALAGAIRRMLADPALLSSRRRALEGAFPADVLYTQRFEAIRELWSKEGMR